MDIMPFMLRCCLCCSRVLLFLRGQSVNFFPRAAAEAAGWTTDAVCGLKTVRSVGLESNRSASVRSSPRRRRTVESRRRTACCRRRVSTSYDCNLLRHFRVDHRRVATFAEYLPLSRHSLVLRPRFTLHGSSRRAELNSDG